MSTPLEQAARAAADHWAEFLNQPGGTDNAQINALHARLRSPIPPESVDKITAALYDYIVAWFSEREGYKRLVLDHDYHMNDFLEAAIGSLVNERDLPLKTWVIVIRDECGHCQVMSSCGPAGGMTKVEFRDPSGGDSMVDKLTRILGE